MINRLINKLNLSVYRGIYFLVLVIVFSFYYLVKFVFNFDVGGPESGNDSVYYHLFAIGEENYVVNIWALILRYLNDIGIYNRTLVSVLLFILYLIIAINLPQIFLNKNLKSKILPSDIKKRQYALSSFVLAYPAFFWYSTDIYRDVFMVGIFILSIFFIHKYYNTAFYLKKIFFFFFFLLSSYLSYRLRPYLGFSLLVAFFIPWKITGYRLYLLVAIGLITLIVFRNYGFLDPLINYRGDSGFSVGGSTIGIGLSQFYGANFIIAVLKSLVFQLFGLHLNSIKSILVFFIESIPFIFLLKYVLKNRNLLDRFCLFLFYFFCVYGLIWVIGNDNLGTAVRLRIFNYITIAIIAYRIYTLKNIEFNLYRKRSII